MMWDVGWTMGGFGWVFMAAWWALFVAAIVWLVRGVSDDRRGPGPSSARRILDERFASGDLSRDEYEERRRVLR